jgi:tellurite resistance protein TerA
MNLTTGQNTSITANAISVFLTQGRNNSATLMFLESSAFLLNEQGKISKDDDFVFFNNPDRSDAGVVFNAQNNSIEINLTKVPAAIVKIVFALTISDGVAKKQSFQQVGFTKLTVKDQQNNNELAVFELNTQAHSETALIMGELYRRNAEWKFKAIGQGFNGGLQPLAELYGVHIGEGESSVAEPVPTVVTPPPPPAAKIELKKTVINLQKSGDKATISLAKGAKVTARLKWNSNADLDLYCFYVDDKEHEGKVYYRNLGDLNAPPFIKLKGDSKIAGEEVIEISQPDKVRYALIAAYSAISNGVGSFYSYKAHCVITDNQQQTVTTHLANEDPYSYWVALAKIDFSTMGELTIENVETYANEKTFIQQFKERTGKKPGGLFKKAKVNGVDSYDPECSPHLFKEGSFMMSVGEVEFK